eukprot:scaffold2236_cov385-Prasinococcus_capsulatus_cf.AAC.9
MGPPSQSALGGCWHTVTERQRTGVVAPRRFGHAARGQRPPREAELQDGRRADAGGRCGATAKAAFGGRAQGTTKVPTNGLTELCALTGGRAPCPTGPPEQA